MLCLWGFPGSSAGKEATCSAGDPSSIPELGRSLGEENSMDCIDRGVTKSQTRLGEFHYATS